MKKIILVGPCCAGKTFIRDKFRERGYEIAIPYTTRAKRENEQNGVDYIFITKDGFKKLIEIDGFYEYAQHGESLYGTGLYEWNNCEVFILETEGISKISVEDRKNCLIMFVNTTFDVRLKRMRERKWTPDMIHERCKTDEQKFKNFKNFDVEISSVVDNC